MPNFHDILDTDVLPSLPAVALKVLSCSSDGDIDDLARIIAQDPPLSARVLKIANSPFYSPTMPVGNIKRAITFLGYRLVRALSLAFSLVPSQTTLDFTLFWKHALATAVGARRILSITNPRYAGEGFTAGLLANIGVFLLAGARPLKYRAILVGCERMHVDPILLEREIFGFDHIALGEAAAQRWRFPQSLHAVIAHHHDPTRFMGDSGIEDIVQSVHAAVIIAGIAHSPFPKAAKKSFFVATQQFPHLSEIRFDEVMVEVERETGEIAAWMGIGEGGKGSACEVMLQAANKRLVAINGEFEEVVQWIRRTQLCLVRTR